MKLEGSLDTFPLRELIEMVAYSSVTGALNIFGPGDPGRLYFRDGTLYHVERGPAQGVEALAELFEHSSATFVFISDMRAETESLWGLLAQHLQHAERLAARWRQLRSYLPTLDLMPALVLPREAAQRRTGPAHYPVLDAIDGQSDLRKLAASVGWAEIDVAEAVVQMAVDGLIDLRSQRAAPPPPAAHAGAARPVVGVFDRLRARGPAPQRLGGEAETARPADGRPSEDFILQLLRS